MTVTVTDNGSGQLTASKEIKKGDAAAPEGIKFTNTYEEEKPAPKKASLTLRKVNASHAGTMVPGATYGIYKVSDEKAESVTTVQDAQEILKNESNYYAYPDESSYKQKTSEPDGMISFTGLGEGTYIIREEEAPDNYLKTEEPVVVKVTKTKDGDAVISSVITSRGKAEYGNGAITWYEEEKDKTVTISKRNADGKEIEGATLTVTDENGRTIDAWTSKKDESHKITVKSGTYTLTEQTAPEGYEKAEQVTFTVSVEGKVSVDGSEVNVVTMIDNYSKHTDTINKQKDKDKGVKTDKQTVVSAKKPVATNTAGAPATGDSSKTTGWFIALLLAAFALVILRRVKALRKKEK